MNILLISGLALILLIAVLIVNNIIKNHKSGADLIDLGEITTINSSVTIDKVMEPADYFASQDIVIVAEIINEKKVEVIDLGEIGILGSKLTIENVSSEYSIDDGKYEEALAHPKGDASASDQSVSDQAIANETVSDSSASDDGAISDNEGKEDEEKPPKSVIYKPSVVEYVKAESSCEKFNYIVYAPENADEDTPVFLFLHGIGENGASYQTYLDTFAFLKYLINGQWKPDFVVIAPIMVKGSKWSNETTAVKNLIGEVVDNYGGSMDKLYIGGFSAGCDAITPLAKSINFQGAIYMAGHMGGSGNTTDAASFMELWKNKRVFYFRDSLYKGGGYGYSASYIETLSAQSNDHGILFIPVDMDWDHRSAMVDAVFLPGYFKDNKGQYCHDAVTDLIF